MSTPFREYRSAGDSDLAELLVALRQHLAALGKHVDLIGQHDGRAPTASVPALEYRRRRVRDALFPPGLFSDPCWDMLLDLYANRSAGRRVSVSSACIGAAVPQTTALRNLNLLIERGLVVRRRDPRDARRVFVDLTADACERMELWIASAAPPGSAE